MITITDRDIRTQVLATLPTDDASLSTGIDVDGIVRTIIDRHGLVDLDTIDADTYWGIVAAHDETQA